MRPLVVKGRAARLGLADASDPVSPNRPQIEPEDDKPAGQARGGGGI